MMGDKMYRNTYVEIDVQQVKQNIENLIKYNDKYKYYIGVVKGNAYGHGLKISKWLIDGGINYLAVSTLDEALEIRENVSKDIPILILQPIDLEYIDICVKNNITITISNYQYFNDLLKLNISNLKVHLKIDTGMNRLGINNKQEINEIYNKLISNKKLELEGIYTHLSTVGIMDNRFDNQIKRFKELTCEIDLNKIKIVHIYSSVAFVIHPKLDFTNGVRLGIVMYGIGPRKINTKGLKNYLRKFKRDLIRRRLNLSPINEEFNISIKPVLKLCSEVSEIKKVNRNEYVGYGSSYKLEEDTLIAIVPVGYMDGLSLKTSGRNVVINKQEYPIVGVINMGMITVKVDDRVKVKDKVMVISNIREESRYIDSTPHQLLTSISPKLERLYKGEK